MRQLLDEVENEVSIEVDVPKFCESKVFGGREEV